MVCNNCGKTFDDNASFCPACGAIASQPSVQQQPAEQNPYDDQPFGQNQGEPVYQMPNYQAQNYQAPNYQMPNYQMPNQPVNSEPPVTMGKYIGWMLLASLFGPISIVISVIFACMGEKKNRANFFRAHLVVWAVMFVLMTILSIVLATVFSTIGLSLLNEMENYYSNGFLSLMMNLF